MFLNLIIVIIFNLMIEINMIVIKFKMIHLNHQFLIIIKDLLLDKIILNNNFIILKI